MNFISNYNNDIDNNDGNDDVVWNNNGDESVGVSDSHNE